MALDKFNWQNGSQVEPAKVEVEGVSYDVVDAQYEGETPLSAANLNLMQDTLLSNVKDNLDDDTKIPSCKAVKDHIKGTILYDNASGNNGNINLNNDIQNYDYLEIFGFESTNQSQLYAKYDVSLNKNFTISSIVGQQNGNLMRIEAKTYTISGSSMTVNSSSHINVFTKVVNEQTSTTNIYITKVIGYKTGL